MEYWTLIDLRQKQAVNRHVESLSSATVKEVGLKELPCVMI